MAQCGNNFSAYLWANGWIKLQDIHELGYYAAVTRKQLSTPIKVNLSMVGRGGRQTTEYKLHPSRYMELKNIPNYIWPTHLLSGLPC